MENVKNRIPKIVHYCWFGGKPIPSELQVCLDTWKKLEGYEIKRWDESNCSFTENEFVRSTYAKRQLGFIGDYYRLKAVYEYGGIYLDTDVKIYKSFDQLLHHNCFFNFIFDCSVGTAIFGAEPHNPFVGALLNMYDHAVLRSSTEKQDLEWQGDTMVAYSTDDNFPTSNFFWTWYLLHEYKDFRLNNQYQDLGDFVIYPKDLFEIGNLLGTQYAIHLNSGVWRTDHEAGGGMKDRIKSAISKCPPLYDKVQVCVRKKRYERLKKDIPFYKDYLRQREER